MPLIGSRHDDGGNRVDEVTDVKCDGNDALLVTPGNPDEPAHVLTAIISGKAQCPEYGC
jgi:hypothetical protein